MRLELTRRTDLATRALQELGREPTKALVKGSDLAVRLHTTAYFLPQVMKPLVGAGWVRSVPGPGGGYVLTPDARSVTLRQVIEAIEGPVVDGQCVLRDAPCPATTECALHEPWSRARTAMLAALDSAPVVGPQPRRKEGKRR